jgi:hypothetical protein
LITLLAGIQPHVLLCRKGSGIRAFKSSPHQKNSHSLYNKQLIKTKSAK